MNYEKMLPFTFFDPSPPAIPAAIVLVQHCKEADLLIPHCLLP